MATKVVEGTNIPESGTDIPAEEEVKSDSKTTAEDSQEEKQEQSAEEATGKKSAKGKDFGSEVKSSINEAIKQMESFGKAIGSALQDRSNVVMVRISNDSLDYLDMMVEADIAKSRSEAAAYLINEGIKSNETLFHKIRDITDQISALKAQLRETTGADK